jgi:hypothetical protein
LKDNLRWKERNTSIKKKYGPDKFHILALPPCFLFES